MTLQTYSGEVSEDISRVRNRRDESNCDTRSRAFSVLCVRNLSARKCGSSTFRAPRSLFEICFKSCVYGCLDAFCRWLPLARLARLSEVMVLGITSPCKPLKTLVLLAKARLARLFLPMLTCTHACVRIRVIKNHAYRSGLKITSPNLANLASGFSSARTQISVASIHRTTLRTDARFLPSRPRRRPSHSSRQWAGSGPTIASASMAMALNTVPAASGSSQKNPTKGARGNSSATTQSLFI